MKPGRRALGVAESYRGRSDEGTNSTLGGAVVRGNRVLDDVVFATCRVGGLDATEAIVDCWERLDRPDVRYLFVAGIAPAWYNIVDIESLSEAIDRPVISVSFEESTGLEDALREAFDGEALEARLERYERLPARRRVETAAGDLFVRSAGIDRERATQLVEASTFEGRPEPLRAAKLVAAAGDTFRRNEGPNNC